MMKIPCFFLRMLSDFNQWYIKSSQTQPCQLQFQSIPIFFNYFWKLLQILSLLQDDFLLIIVLLFFIKWRSILFGWDKFFKKIFHHWISIWRKHCKFNILSFLLKLICELQIETSHLGIILIFNMLASLMPLRGKKFILAVANSHIRLHSMSI